MNTGWEAVRSSNRLLTTIAWDTGDGVYYALEGSVFNAGTSVKWLRDQVGLIKARSRRHVGRNGAGYGGVYFVPAFTGLGALYWDMYAGNDNWHYTRNEKEHIIRAALESIAYQSKDVFDAMVSDAGTGIKELQSRRRSQQQPFCDAIPG